MSAQPRLAPPIRGIGGRVRDEIYSRIMEAGWSNERRAFVQHEGSTVLDAAVLMLPLAKFISPHRSEMAVHVGRAHQDVGLRLVGVPLRTRRPVRTGSAGREGTFTVCSFWHVRGLDLEPDGSMKHESPSRRCSRMPITSDCTQNRSARPESNRATSRRPLTHLAFD